MSSSIGLIRSDALSDAADYAYASVVPAGTRLILPAGSCPLNRDGTTAAIGEHDVPSTLMGVTVLGYDDQLVEIEAVAAVVQQDNKQPPQS